LVDGVPMQKISHDTFVALEIVNLEESCDADIEEKPGVALMRW